MLCPIDDSWYHRPPGIPEDTSAGGVVVRRSDSELLVALVRSGRWHHYVLPKGRLEQGETIQQAALREIEEEAGFSHLIHLGDLGLRERLNYSKRRWKKVHYFLFLTSQVEGRPTDRHKSYESAWFPLHHLPAMLWPEQKALIEVNRDWIEAIALRQS